MKNTNRKKLNSRNSNNRKRQASGHKSNSRRTSGTKRTGEARYSGGVKYASGARYERGTRQSFQGRGSKSRRRRRRDGLEPLQMFAVVASVVMLVLVISYVSGAIYYNSHFLKGTVINGIDVSGMTLDELKTTIKDYDIIVRQRGKGDKEVYAEKITGDDIGIQIVSGSGIEEILDEQNVFLWFLESGESYEKDTLIEYDSRLLAERIVKLKGLSDEYATKPTDAHISEYNTQSGYEIIPETYGNFLDVDRTNEVLNEAISNLKLEVNLDKEGCYLEPKLDSGDKNLNQLLNQMNKLVSVEITYDFGGNKEIVDGRSISKWIVVNDYQASLDSELVEEYVATLRKKYDTIFRSRIFNTSYGSTVTIKKGDYGWWMNYVKETEELKAQIEEGKSGQRTPVYYQTAAQYGAKDYGDTYVEINLTAQHLFLYVDGVKVLESDFVSGNTSNKWGTPAGVYGITYKERYGKLVGETYESTVAYWMPFNGDIGLHDAIWKTQFGSDFYKTDGSHGCINLPYLVAKAIYEQVEKGTPVICYKLKGTESASVTVQSYEEIAKAAIEAIDAIGEVTKDSKEKIETARYMYDKVGKKAREYVTNAKVLTTAEALYKEMTKEEETTD